MEDLPAQLEEGLLTIFALDQSKKYQVVGTGFVVRAFDSNALVVSAAHVFEGVQRLQQNRTQRSHHSTLPEFRPAPRPIDLTLEKFAMYTKKEEQPVIGHVEGIAFDSFGDFGVAQIKPQKGDEAVFPLREFILDDKMPDVGQLVFIASYANLSSEANEAGGTRFGRRLIVRVGRVTATYPEGHRLCRGPCFETSIPVYSGMSGSPVCLYGKDAPLKAIGLVCSDLDIDGPQKDDRTVAGLSLIAKMPVKRIAGHPDGLQTIEFEFKITAGSGTFSNNNDIEMSLSGP